MGQAHAQSDPAESGDPPAETPPAGAESDDNEAGDALPDLKDNEDPLSRHRTRLDVLAERAIGTASKPVAFNWRRTNVHLAATGSFLFELNNFNSLRGGGLVRLPAKKAIVELGVSWAQVWDTPSSRLLAYTPYRQPGHPSRMELDIILAYPLAEGVVTTFPRFFPAVQMVFNVCAGFRYDIYPNGWPGMRPGQVAAALFNPSLTEIELEHLDNARLDAMQTDLGRYGLTMGFSNDLYFEQGFFISPRVTLSLPLLAPISQTHLVMWADFNIAIGMAF